MSQRSFVPLAATLLSSAALAMTACQAGGETVSSTNAAVEVTGTYTLVSVNSGMCLDVTGISKSDGAPVQQWGCWNGPNQEWTVSPASDGTFELER